MNRKLIFILLLLMIITPTETGIVAVVKIGQLFVNVLGFGIKVWNAFRPSNDEKESDVQLLQNISKMIQSSEMKIIETITLQNKMSPVDDAVKNIGSSLTDLDNIVKANDSETKQEYLELFLDRFKEHDVIKDLRFLPKMLQYTSAGTSPRLIDLFVEHNRCNYEFKMFFFNLVASGIAEEKVYLMHMAPSTVTDTEDWWAKTVAGMDDIFNQTEISCMTNFLKFAEQDVESATNAKVLLKNNKERYLWKTNDVFFLPPHGTHQFLYMKYTEGSCVWKRSDQNKIVVFMDKDGSKPDNLTLFHENVTKPLRSSIRGKEDTSAAMHIGMTAEKLLHMNGYSLIALLVFFDGDHFASHAIEFDNGSQVIYTEVDEVELKYCYETGFLCDSDPLNWFKNIKTVRGKMKVAAYITEIVGSPFSYKISGAAGVYLRENWLISVVLYTVYTGVLCLLFY